MTQYLPLGARERKRRRRRRGGGEGGSERDI